MQRGELLLCQALLVESILQQEQQQLVLQQAQCRVALVVVAPRALTRYSSQQT